ncbi:MAG: hypothetical protein RLZZ628_1186 [Bacteroidota bacterium]|jgi:hypothetical protein
MSLCVPKKLCVLCPYVFQKKLCVLCPYVFQKKLCVLCPYVFQKNLCVQKRNIFNKAQNYLLKGTDSKKQCKCGAFFAVIQIDILNFTNLSLSQNVPPRLTCKVN